jgi:hypothetical protein
VAKRLRKGKQQGRNWTARRIEKGNAMMRQANTVTIGNAKKTNPN